MQFCDVLIFTCNSFFLPHSQFSIQNMKAFIFIFIPFFILISCHSSVVKEKKEDSNSQPNIVIEESKDNNESDSTRPKEHSKEFNGLPITNNLGDIIAKTKSVKNEDWRIKTENGNTSIKTFLKMVTGLGNNFGEDISPYSGLLDLDNDGVSELLIGYFTGGGHCCDDLWIGKLIAPHLFENAFTIQGGWIQLDSQKNFIFSPDELLGYFYTCYTCDGDYKSPYNYNYTNAYFRYKNGVPVFVLMNESRKEQIISNLNILSNQSIPELDEEGTDEIGGSGFRKNFAKNIFALYFNSEGDKLACKKFFNKYYKGKDSDSVWNKLKDYLSISLLTERNKK